MPHNNQIIFSKKEENFSTRFEKIEIVLHGFDKIENVSVDNKNISLAKEENTFTFNFTIITKLLSSQLTFQKPFNHTTAYKHRLGVDYNIQFISHNCVGAFN